MRFANIILASCCIVMAGTSAAGAARMTEANHLNFRDIEYRTDNDGAESVGQSAVAQAIPIGSSAAAAEAALHIAGARPILDRQPSEHRYRFVDAEGVDDHLREIIWTVTLKENAGLVQEVTAQRSSIGF